MGGEEVCVCVCAYCYLYSLVQFPQMKDRIKGEESSRFVNGSGVEMFIGISDKVDSTVKQLITAFDGRDQLAKRLAKVVHGDREAVPIDGQFKHRLECVDVDLGRLGIWIDPIGQLLVGYCSSVQWNLPLWTPLK